MSSHDRDDYDSEGLDELSDVDQPVASTTQRPGKLRSGRRLERPSAQDEERIDYDDDDDEEEEDDEDYDDSGKRNPRKKKRRQNIFLDVEAEVDEDEEEEEEDGEDLEGFIQEEGEEAAAAAEARRGARHRALDRDRETQQEFNPEEMAARLSAKYGKRDTYHRRGAPGAAMGGASGGAGGEAYEQDEDYIPQKFLMPGVQDPNLWMVKCIPGKEKDIMLKLMHRYFDTEYSDRPLDILSAFCRDSLKGYIYIEARKQAYVQAAIDRINGLFASTIMLVPINEMVDVVKIRRREAQLQPGSWVRVKRGKYAGDLARVIGVEDALDKVEIRLIPRLDYGNQHREAADADDAAKKRKKGGFPYSNPNEPRPPQRLFNPREADKLDRSKPLMARGRGVYVYGADTFRDGFLEKAVKVNSLITQNVNPTLDEITKFSTADGGDEEEQALSLSALAGSAATETLSAESIRPGDNVEVTEGDMVHVHGIVTSVDGDVAHVHPLVEGLPDSLRFPIRQLRKRFRTGDHVRVVSGHHTGETGMIVTVADNVVTLLSDLSVKEVTVFARDLRDAADAGTMTKSVTVSGNFELYDFVTLENNAVAVIVKIEGDNFQIMDQDGDVRLVKGAQMTPRRNTRNAAATDAHNNVIRVGDQVRELDSIDRRSGNVLHLNRRYCFMRSREILEHGGVFVAPTRKVAAVGRGAAGINGNSMAVGNNGGFLHPGGMRGGMRGGRGRGASAAGNPFHQRRGPRDRLISATVMITKGPYKSYIGIVKDAAGSKARVELHTNSRLINIDKDSLVVQDRFGKFVPLHDMPELMGPPSSAMMRGPR
ncbi:transcription elongation factor spt5, partial [Dimargaris xerosporica]